MLTRLKVSGFKNLVDVDVRFGAFTCIAGANGVGKSNLFDAIRFLSALAEMPLRDAAQSIVDKDERAGDIRELFHKIGDEFSTEMSFEAEIVIPRSGLDDLGRSRETDVTVLKYSLVLTYGEHSHELYIVKEDLLSIPKEAFFVHADSRWIDSLDFDAHETRFIWTDINADTVNDVNIQDAENHILMLPANMLRRTFLSSENLAFKSTVYLAKREMQSWRLLQLEPSALRKPDRFTDSGKIGADGAHLPSSIERLIRHAVAENETINENEARENVLASISNRLAELIENVGQIYIDRDEGRQRLTLYLTHTGTSHPAHALSDGTLRFLALSVLEMDTADEGVICLEEPENGIHPGRIPAMLRLVQDLTTDVKQPLDRDNPLRQVIINTHSPVVVKNVPEDSLLIAKSVEAVENGKRFTQVVFGSLPGTWRAKNGSEVISMAELVNYLDPAILPDIEAATNGHKKPKRVIEREDVKQLLLPFMESIDE
jgi:predicted ATPase